MIYFISLAKILHFLLENNGFLKILAYTYIIL